MALTREEKLAGEEGLKVQRVWQKDWGWRKVESRVHRSLMKAKRVSARLMLRDDPLVTTATEGRGLFW